MTSYNDRLIRVISEKGNVLGLACATTHLTNEARTIHKTSITATAALGRALTGGALMASLLKRDQRLSFKIEGDGPLRKIIVEADRNGYVRGFVGNPQVEIPPKNGKIDVGSAVGKNGTLTVIKDLGTKSPLTGIVRLITGEIAEDLTYYYAESEQIPTAIGLGVYVNPDGSVKAAGGFLIQTLPPIDERTTDELIDRISKIKTVTEHLLAGKTEEDLISLIFGPIPYHILERYPLYFRCRCDRKMIEKVILALGEEEISSIIEERGEAEITCEFCRQNYYFNKHELENLLKIKLH
ncbi:MAG: Hsp33 family molecular chaperone HslO [Syntrophales bacterium]|nr:Hsp33 family molecular chaperone HslO [Syntrophales bacterium]